jgi:hypothetical protein
MRVLFLNMIVFASNTPGYRNYKQKPLYPTYVIVAFPHSLASKSWQRMRPPTCMSAFEISVTEAFLLGWKPEFRLLSYELAGMRLLDTRIRKYENREQIIARPDLKTAHFGRPAAELKRMSGLRDRRTEWWCLFGWRWGDTADVVYLQRGFGGEEEFTGAYCVECC